LLLLSQIRRRLGYPGNDRRLYRSRDRKVTEESEAGITDFLKRAAQIDKMMGRITKIDAALKAANSIDQAIIAASRIDTGAAALAKASSFGYGAQYALRDITGMTEAARLAQAQFFDGSFAHKIALKSQYEALDLAALNRHAEQFRSISGAFEAADLTKQAIGLFPNANTLFGIAPELQSRMEAMSRPWILEDAARSAFGFSAMQSIGAGLIKRLPFEPGLTTVLRTNLGDWRDPLELPLPTVLDSILRSDFYVQRGFNPALTDFSEAAFAESAELAGLLEQAPAEKDEDDTEIGLKRNLEAFDRFQRFEKSIRHFIDKVMTNTFGESWIKSRTPSGMFDDWKRKQSIAENAGEAKKPLIEYADFTDYKKIIERSDNWRDVFATIFGRPEDVRESFQRLYPVRIATMHARIITLDDEMLLIVETKRLLKAFSSI
jgi:hypothetical protein